MKTETQETATRVMTEFNLSDDSYGALPRGLAGELDALIRQRDELLEALDDICREVNNGCKDRQARLLQIRAIYLKLRENKLLP